jgi:dihydrofolate reductase
LPHLVYYVASSLDGYIADDEGKVDWLPDAGPDQDFGYGEFIKNIDALLIGRRTFDQVLTFGDWPYTGLPTRVWTRRPLIDPPELVEPIAGSPHEVTAALDAESFGRVWLVGGAALAETLRREGLIDEWIITLIPLTLGSGIPLFGGAQEAMSISSVETYPGAILQLHLGHTD